MNAMAVAEVRQAVRSRIRRGQTCHPLLGLLVLVVCLVLALSSTVVFESSESIVVRTARTQSALPTPEGVDLSRAASTVLLRGCGPDSQTNGDGVRCRADLILPELLALPAERRFDPALANPCLRRSGGCVPYFYLIGAFHGGVRDIFSRLRAHPRVISATLPSEAQSPAAERAYTGEFFSEAHPWERMLWRGCDWGGCPRRRGAGAEPFAFEGLPGVRQGAVFGEAAPGALSFTWSATFSLLHSQFQRAFDACHARAKGDALAVRECYPLARGVQEAWEAKTLGATSALPLSMPWLMRAVHGTSQVRLIALLREPASRLFSAFWFWPQYRRKYGASADGFHAFATETMAAWDGCVVSMEAIALAQQQQQQQRRRQAPGARAADDAADAPPPTIARGYSQARVRAALAELSTPPFRARGHLASRRVLESCASEFESLSGEANAHYYHADQLLRSLYAAFLPAWIDAFGRERLLLLRSEDVWARPRAELARAFDFLGLEQPTDAQWEPLLAAPVVRVRGSANVSYWADKAITNYLVPRPAGMPGAPLTRMRVPMRADTAAELADFFRPYNEALAELADEPGFLWGDVAPPTAVIGVAVRGKRAFLRRPRAE
jgi:hypothetical protein